MIQNTIAAITEKVLLQHLAPDPAKRVAQEVASASTDAVQVEINRALAGLLGSADHAPVAAGKKTGGGGGGGGKAKSTAAARPAAAPGTRELSAEARKVMSFKKALYHAKTRAEAVKKGEREAPEPWDKLIFAAAAEGKIISVEQAKRMAAAEAKKAKNGVNGYAATSKPKKGGEKKAKPKAAPKEKKMAAKPKAPTPAPKAAAPKAAPKAKAPANDTGTVSADVPL